MWQSFVTISPGMSKIWWTEKKIKKKIKTRLLAINVSIPNLTVARLEQSPSPQMTDNKPSFTRKLHVVIFRQSSFAPNAVPKLVVMAMSLIPSISAMSLLDSLSQKPTPRIKQRVASCHTTEVVWIQNLPAPPTHQGDSRSQRWVGDPLHVRYGRPNIGTD